MTISLIQFLALVAFVLAIAAAASRVPLWIAVFVLSLIVVMQVWP